MLLCLPFLLFSLHCIAAHDLNSRCALASLSTKSSDTSEVNLCTKANLSGKSLLQAYSHRGTWRTAGLQNFTNAKDIYPTTAFEGLGQFCLCVFFVVLVGSAYLCCSRHTKHWGTGPCDASSASAETRQESVPEGVSSETDASARRSAVLIESLAANDESDDGDWVVGADDAGDSYPPNYDPDCIPKYIDEHFSSWKLLMAVAGSLAQFWGALAFMYWSLLFRSEELMTCNAYPVDGANAFFAIHACHYTLACLQGFPTLAANMILVIMIRTLLQTRFYYSMLRSGYIVVFQTLPIMKTMWPYVIGFSISQGALHFVLKAWFVPDGFALDVWARLVRKFVLPGSIFFSLLFRYADIENTLVPLNHIAELEVSQAQHFCPWLANAKVVNERVIAFEVRHRNVYAETMHDVGRPPTLHDIMQNVINNYESASQVWSTRSHRSWGLFRSMWPAELLWNRHLDWNDKDTRSWLQVATIIAGGSTVLSLLTVYSLLATLPSSDWHIFASNIRSSLETQHVHDTATNLRLVVTVCHAVVVIVLMVNAIRGMFYFSLSQAEKDLAKNPVSEAPAEVDRAEDKPCELAWPQRHISKAK